MIIKYFLTGWLLISFFIGGCARGNPIVQFIPSAPKIVSVSPADLATGVLVSAIITVTFDRAVDIPTINTNNFYLQVGSSKINGTVSYEATSKQATFSPLASLLPGTVYTAVLTTGLKSSDGVALENNYTWSFTTKS